MTTLDTVADVQISGVEVDPSLVRRWREWLAPPAQPFYLSAEQAEACGVAPDSRSAQMSDELRDTFAAWRIARDLQAVWLDELTFHALPRDARSRLVRAQVVHRRGLVPTVRQWSNAIGAAELRSQADGHRFVWWQSLLERVDDSIIGMIVSRREALPPSQHGAVTANEWKSAARALPRAEQLAGTLPSGSGPNCFGTVMAAAGVDGAAEAWMMQEPFETWLTESTRTGGDDMQPGTVLVWRDPEGTAQHTAVTLGGGWGLHKPSQCWWTPRTVLPARELIRGSRSPGLRLHRYTLR
ncbi:MAG TPA: hypothetical protein VL551_12875 [Actinospica sp.]|nr:hypothetical protein [Actinospica sp.]